MKLGRYRIDEYLGSGSYAIVYRAVDTVLNRTVALKVLKPIWAADGEIFARFMREARSAANLIHPQIAWVIDIGEIDEKHYLAIRYIDGVALDKLLARRGALSWISAVSVLEQIGQALDYAHQRSMVHRDIKPQNILISDKEGAVLTDFGLVKPMQENSLLTQSGAIVGTPQYIAPEIWNGEPSSPASDQYAMVCVFLEMLTGKILFEGALLETIIQKHLNEDVLSGGMPAFAPPGAEQVLRKALAKHPQMRYPSLQALVDALRALETQGAVKPASPLLPEQERKPSTLDASTTSHSPPHARPSASPRASLRSRAADAPVVSSSSSEWQMRLQRLYQRITTGASGSKPRYQFTLLTGSQSGQAFPILQEDTLIGRSERADLVIDDPDVSRQHARLLITEEGCVLLDLRSTNGTFINGVRLIGESYLESGDQILLGKRVTFRFERSD